jgi:hypothetical protein
MHAEHADNSEMNDMSARNKAPKRATQTSWFGGYFVDPIRLSQPRLKIKRVAHGL